MKQAVNVDLQHQTNGSSKYQASTSIIRGQNQFTILLVIISISMNHVSMFTAFSSSSAVVAVNGRTRTAAFLMRVSDERKISSLNHRCNKLPLIASFRRHQRSFQLEQQQSRIRSNTFLPISSYSSLSSLEASAATPESSSSTKSLSIANPNPLSNTQQQQHLQINATMVQRTKETGGLRRLPLVKPPNDMISSARKSLYKVRIDTDMKNIRLRIRKYGAETINTFMIALCTPLREIVKGYEHQWKHLHPFERVVADLTTSTYGQKSKDNTTLPGLLHTINEGRKMILEASKEWIYKIKNADTSSNSKQYTSDAIDAIIDLYEIHVSPHLLKLMEIQKLLRSSPIVQTNTPTIVLIGTPNVGKSSIVRAISSATPEVNNYPFTTRGISLGHIEVFWKEQQQPQPPLSQHNDTELLIDTKDASISPISTNFEIVKASIPTVTKKRKNGYSMSADINFLGSDGDNSRTYSQLCQVMDSPGLLIRDTDDDRNAMELLTLACMQHLPTAVCFILDLSGNAGDKCSSIQDQLQLRKEMRKRFPRRPWIDIVSKYDLPVDDDVIQQLENEVLVNPIDGTKVPYIQLSIHKGIGLQELRTEILRMLSDVRVVLDAMATIQQQQQLLANTQTINRIKN